MGASTRVARFGIQNRVPLAMIERRDRGSDSRVAQGKLTVEQQRFPDCDGWTHARTAKCLALYCWISIGSQAVSTAMIPTPNAR